MTPFLFVGGKGGVGKTTCAAMLALESARRRRTLLVTTDPAPSLSSVLKARVGRAPAPVAGAPGLWAAAVDSRLAFARWLAPRRDLVAEIALEGTYLDSDDVERLLKLSLPGIDEIVGLLEIFNLAHAWPKSRPVRVVVDTAPTGHTLRLLQAPALFGRLAAVLESLQAHHRIVVSALRGYYSDQPADRLVAEMSADAEAMAAILRAPHSTELTWVTLPEPAALEETADAVAALDATGIHVGRLIVNRMTRLRGREHRCAWCRARRQFEERALAPVARRFQGREIQSLPDFDAEPRGLPQLRRAARTLDRYHPASAPPPLARRLRARQPGSGLAASGSSVIDLAGGARWILVGGKGGVGKSTCAAALALRLAASDVRKPILLLSTDPAHSIGDILGTRLDDRARAIAGAPPNLRAREIDAVTRFDEFKRQYVDSVEAAFAGLSKAGGPQTATFRQLIDLAPPGIDEVIAVADVADALADPSGPCRIVTDTAPTGHALRLLQTPAVLHDWVKALMAILLKYRDILGAGPLASLLVDLSKRLRLLQAAILDPAVTRFLVVTRAAAVPMEESRALESALSGLGITTAGIIVNAVGAGSCTRCAKTIRQQQGVLAGLLRAARSRERQCAIIEAPAELPPPRGPEALVRWSAAWRRLADPAMTA